MNGSTITINIQCGSKRNMKLMGSRGKASLFVGIGAVLLSFGFLPLNAFLPACLYWEIRPTLANGEGQYVRIGYFVGSSFIRVDVLVSGGDNLIAVSLMDGTTKTLTSDIVNISQSILYDTPKNDFYILYLKNSYNLSSTNSKQILVKIYYYFYNYLFGVVGTILLVSGSILVLYFYITKREQCHRARASSILCVSKPPACAIALFGFHSPKRFRGSQPCSAD